MVKFDIGQVVYVVRRSINRLYVQAGIVDEIFNKHSVNVDYLTMRETRTVRGVPIRDYKDDKYYKLPKNWSEVDLREMGVEKCYEEVKSACMKVRINDIEGIKDLYDKGYMVKMADTFTGRIETDITKDGYRVFKTYFNCDVCVSSCYPVSKVYETYEEAFKQVSDYYDELNRQAALSDEEWSLEQIDKELGRWKGAYNVSNKDVQKTRDYLLGMSDIASLEIRIFKGKIEWKREKNRKWIAVPDDMRW